MAKIYGQLERAQLENLAADPASAVQGYVYWHTGLKRARIYTGTIWQNIGSGGSGGAIAWVEDENAPIPAVENKRRIYQFQAALGQELYAEVRVPDTFAAGSQIRALMTFYSPDSSNTAHLKSQSTLVRPGTDLITSTTNQRTSTNAAVTLTGGTVNIPQAVILDLTDTSGQINGVAVAAGDLVRIRLYRDAADTAVSDLKVPVYGAEVTFS
jgi:hypothetical protein